jgi:hypothetical protein
LEHSRLVKLSFRIEGFGGVLLDVTNLMGKVTSESVRWFGRNSWTRSFEWRNSHARDRTRRPSEPRKGYCGLAGGPFTVTAQLWTARGMVQALIKALIALRPTTSVCPQPAIVGNVRAQRFDAPTGGGERAVPLMRPSPERLCDDR